MFYMNNSVVRQLNSLTTRFMQQVSRGTSRSKDLGLLAKAETRVVAKKSEGI